MELKQSRKGHTVQMEEAADDTSAREMLVASPSKLEDHEV